MARDLTQKLQDFFAHSGYPFVLLFGSFADGSQHAMSDVDLGVALGEKDLMDFGYDLAQLEGLLGRRIDGAILDEVYKKDPLFSYEVYRRHLPIVYDPAAYEAFKRNALLYYLDHLPLIEQNRKSLERRIEQGRVGERNYD